MSESSLGSSSHVASDMEDPPVHLEPLEAGILQGVEENLKMLQPCTGPGHIL